MPEKGENEGRKEQQLRETLTDNEVIFHDQDAGWAWVVMFASFMNFSLISAALYAVGIIHATLLEKYGASVSLTAWAGALNSALVSLAGPISSAITERFSCRVALVTAGVLYLIGYGLTALAPNIQIAILTCGVISGTAGGIAYTANTVSVGYYFKKRRNLALGLANSGSGLGLFLLAPLMQWIKDEYGSFGFFLLLAGIFSNMITFGMLCCPSEMEIHSKHKRSLSVSTSHGKCSIILRYLDVLKNKGILFYSLAMFNYCLAVYLMYLYFPHFIVQKGFTSAQAAFFLSISGVFSIVGRVTTGAIANFRCVNDIVLYSVSIAIVGISSIIYPFIASHYAGQVAYFVLLGLFMGTSFVLTTSVSLKFISAEVLATAIGLEYAFGGVGSILGPVLAGAFIDSGGTYDQVFIIAAHCAVLAALIGGVTLCFDQKSVGTEVIMVEKCTEIIMVEKTADNDKLTSANGVSSCHNGYPELFPNNRQF